MADCSPINVADCTVIQPNVADVVIIQSLQDTDMVFSKRVDFTTNNTVIYIAEAVPGTLNANALWRLKRLTIASDDDVVEEWADGTAALIKIWDNRLTYTYT